MSLLLTLTLALAPTYPPGEEPFPFAPAVEALYSQGFEALEKNDSTEAHRLAEQVTNKAPDNPRGWRLLGQALARTNQLARAEEALTRALDLNLDAKRRPDTFGLRGMMRFELKNRRGAEEDARAALALDKEQPFALFIDAIDKAERGKFSEARTQAETLLRVAPEWGSAHTIMAAIEAQDGDMDRAAAEADRARSLGGEVPKFVDEKVQEARWWRMAWQAPLAACAFLGIALLLFFVAGSLLSRMEIARLAEVRELKNEATLGERLVDKLYLLVLWCGTIFFYVSVPLAILITLGVSLGLLYLIFHLPRIPLQAIVLLVIAAGGGVWAILRGLFLGRAPERPGRRLTEAEAPRLFAALREVSQVAGSRMVDRVELDPDANVSVRESGGTLRVLFGGGERVLHIGYAALRDMNVSELKSILAHEYGHFSHGETRLGPVIWRIISTLVSIIQRMAELGWSAAINPVFWYLRLYFKAYLTVSSAQSRRRELLADRVAALAYGGDTFARALSTAIENGGLFDRSAGEVVGSLRESGRPCANLYHCLAAAYEATPEKLAKLRLDEEMGRAPGQFDSHPPPNDRIARVAGISGSRPLESLPATSLFGDDDKLARELTANLVKRIDEILFERGIVVGEARPADGDEQARLAAAVVGHSDALELATRDRAAGDPLVEVALKEVETTAGPKDLLTVNALSNLGHLHAQRGERAQATALFERALAIVEEGPKKEGTRAQELRAMLYELRGGPAASSSEEAAA